MPNKSIKNQLKALTLANKVVGTGAILAVISVFLPWYQDIDRFKTGDMFLGITGPLYLIGGSLLILSCLSLLLVASKVTKREIVKFSTPDSVVHMSVAGISFYLLFIAYSIYFHPQFGLNLVNKQPLMGMFTSLVSSLLIGYGGFLQKRRSRIIVDHHIVEEHETIQKSVGHRTHRIIPDDEPAPVTQETPNSQLPEIDIPIMTDLPQNPDPVGTQNENNPQQ